MTIAEQIYELVKSLPHDEASQILAFAEAIRASYLSVGQSSDEMIPASWSQLVDSLSGSWGDDFPSLDMIRADSERNVRREQL